MPSWWHFAASEGTPGYALVMGLVVGTILTAINQGDFILAGEMPQLRPPMRPLTPVRRVPSSP